MKSQVSSQFLIATLIFALALNAKVFSQEEDEEAANAQSESSEETPAEKQSSQVGGGVLRTASVETNPMHAVLQKLRGDLKVVEIKLAVLEYENALTQADGNQAAPTVLAAKEKIVGLVAESPDVMVSRPEVAVIIPDEIDLDDIDLGNDVPVKPVDLPSPGEIGDPPIIETGNPPKQQTDFYSYDVEGDLLTITFASPDETDKTFTRGEITYEKLEGQSGVDPHTALTIPYLVDVFETGMFEGQPADHFNEVLGVAVDLANDLLSEVKLSGNVGNLSDHPNLYDKSKVRDLLSGNNPYYYQLVKTLATNNAFGDSSDVDGSAGAQAVTRSLEAIFSGGVTSTTVSDLLDKTAAQAVPDAQSKYAELLGVRLDNKAKDSTLFDLPAQNVQGIVGQKITLGDKTAATTIDLTNYLPSKDKPTSVADWKVFGIGAGKDIIVEGDVTFKNSNRHSGTGNVVKDHALAIGALDDIHFHSETWEADWGLEPGFLKKHLDTVADQAPSDATLANKSTRATVDFEGANLYLGSVAKLELVNVNLKSGGNLGVGSLDELSIVSLDPNQRNTITVGQNTNASEGDNIQLYANERILADGLNFEGRVDEVYMQARTVDLKNTTFPGGSEVILVSEYGGLQGKYPTFGVSKRQMGRVNFIDNVKYDTVTIDSNEAFDSLGNTHSITTTPHPINNPTGRKHPITINPFSKDSANPNP